MFRRANHHRLLLPTVVFTAASLWSATPAAAAPRPASPAPAYDPSLFGGVQWRLVGPFRGGRVSSVTGVPGQPRLFYMGACGGGVWRTTDAGARWECVSDSGFGVGSIGAVAVAPSDPNVIYVGTGEETVRGNVSHGDGVYRSTDAGRTWTNVGLADTRQIARVRVHPRDADVAYVAAIGHLYAPNAERGVFRTRDGGRTWKRVLFVNDSTGASELEMDPTNPRILYAGMWQVRRRPWTFESGGAGSGLWKSEDGGDTWKKLTGSPDNGLPKGTLGKICVAVSPARPQRVWAMIEAEDGGLFRSDDGGRNWTRVNEDRQLRQRAWYFSRVVADTKDPDQLWVLNVRLHQSKDGGRTFRGVRTPHGDHHDLWIDPDDPERIVVGDDGGASVSVDGGESWSSVENQPTAQFYRVAVDDAFPYRVYGAQQDNSTVGIPSRTTGFGIERTDWYDVGGGESGWIAPKPGDPNVVYAGSYDGYLTRLDVRTQQQRDINAYPDNPMGSGAEGARYRFQWNFPIVASKHDANVLYTAANVLFRTRDEGQTWETVSGDLTRNDRSKLGPSGGPITKDNTSVEYYCTIFSLAESPKDAATLWAGSDDGLVHVTMNGGASWTNVTPKELPEWSQINAIEASPHDAKTAFVAATRYKLDDFAPYVYVTRDGGRTWRNIVNGIPANAFTRVVRQDPADPDLLYAGTETGVFVSFDAGARWQPLQLNLPVVPVTDLVVKDDDLVAATQGRSFWVLDDLTPLRQLAAASRAKWHLFAPRTAVRVGGGGGFFRASNAGANPPNGAVIRWTLADAPPDSTPIALEILDASGRTLRRFDRKGEVPADTTLDRDVRSPKLAPKKGANTFVWDLRTPSPTSFEGIVLWGGLPAGPRVIPGEYQARLTVGKESQTQRFTVVKDRRIATTDAEFREQFELLSAIRDELTAIHDGIALMREVRAQMDDVVSRAKRAGMEKSAVSDSAKALSKRLVAIEEALYQTKSKSEQDPLNYPIRINDKLANLFETVASADARPTDASRTVWSDLKRQADSQLEKLRTALGPDLAAFNRLVHDSGVPAVVAKRKGGAR